MATLFAISLRSLANSGDNLGGIHFYGTRREFDHAWTVATEHVDRYPPGSWEARKLEIDTESGEAWAAVLGVANALAHADPYLGQSLTAAPAPKKQQRKEAVGSPAAAQ